MDAIYVILIINVLYALEITLAIMEFVKAVIAHAKNVLGLWLINVLHVQVNIIYQTEHVYHVIQHVIIV